ncbi:hypothetical protein FDP41_010326 [Naegleria fowleri]|uniref:Uncharacterized protein n=1 Tax=Naegleria fowleri TaxID=5763 RepID=A0A6A5C811_NAEFO|nr:uncharacterized protein FDP41_010326 [Naegleria fowleri]KAF0983261.1 hypothetical protein FDP41_010326 [Naegleria fowleri]
MADSINHSIIQQEQIDYEQQELDDAISRKEPMIRYGDIKKLLEDCANTHLVPFAEFNFSNQKAALVNYKALTSKKTHKQTQGYFKNYYNPFPKLFYTLPKTSITGAAIFIKKILCEESGHEELREKLKKLPAEYPANFQQLSDKYREYLQSQH